MRTTVTIDVTSPQSVMSSTLTTIFIAALGVGTGELQC